MAKGKAPRKTGKANPVAPKKVLEVKAKAAAKAKSMAGNTKNAKAKAKSLGKAKAVPKKAPGRTVKKLTKAKKKVGSVVTNVKTRVSRSISSVMEQLQVGIEDLRSSAAILRASVEDMQKSTVIDQLHGGVSGLKTRLTCALEAFSSAQRPAAGKGALSFTGLTKANLQQVQAFFKFHDMTAPKRVADPRQWVSLAYVQDFLVGAIMCRLESSRRRDGGYRVYIDSLAVFKPYRRLAVGKMLVQWVLDKVDEEGNGDIMDVYLHTPACYIAAHRFYNKLGFVEEKRVDGYYTKEDGDHSNVAVLFSRKSLIGNDPEVVLAA